MPTARGFLAALLLVSASPSPGSPWQCECTMYSCIEGYLAKKQIPAHGLKDIEAPDKPQAELAFQSEARKEASKACREANDSWRGECSSYVCTELKAIYKK